MSNILKTKNLFKILADETRLRIIELISEKEMCVGDIYTTLNMTQSSISHQLSYLKENNIVKSHKINKNVYYSLADNHIYEIFKMGYEHVNECK